MKFLVSPNSHSYSDRSRGQLLARYMENSGTIENMSQLPKGEIVKISLPPFTPPLLNYLKQNKIKYILDITDYKFHKDSLKQLYIEGAKHAIAITTTCTYLADVCKELFNRPIHIIEDPTERNEKLPNVRKIQKTDTLNLVWYGIRDNMKGVDFNNIKQNLQHIHSNIEIKIITNKKPSDPIDWIQWSYDVQNQLVAEADIVLIPTISNNSVIRSKGNNRPIDAIRQGKFVVSGPLIPSYCELHNFMFVGDLQEGVRYFLHNRKQVERMIAEGQTYIRENRTPEIIAKSWSKLESSLRKV